jgi:SAM-dependent methyltransferase
MELTSCLLCGSDDARSLLRREKPRHVVCRRCGLVYENPRPTLDEMAAFYATGYWEKYEPGIVSGAGSTNRDAIARGQAVVELTRDRVPRGGLIVELGCGPGEILAFVRDRLGCQAIGVEPSVNQSSAARERFGLEMICGGVEDVDLGDRRANLLILSHVLEHFHQPRAALEKCHSLLDSAGWIFIEVPNILCPNPRKRLSKWLSLEHVVYFSPGTLTALLEECGFEAEQTYASTFVRVLARKRPSGVSQPRSYDPREASRVRRALLRHQLRYWPRYAWRRACGLFARPATPLISRDKIESPRQGASTIA